jgi:hypothetical protein
MQAISFGQCVKGAWRDGWRYVQHRPGLVTLMLVLVWMATFVESVLRPDQRPPFRFITYVPLGAFELVKLALLSTLTVHALRFVLLGAREADSEPLFSRHYWRYLGLTLVVVVLVLASVAVGLGLGAGIVWLLAVEHRPGLPILIPVVVGLCMFLALGTGCFLLTRLSLLLTHVAIGGALRIRATWADTRGHCWSLWLTQVVAMLPMMAVSGVAMLFEVAAQRHGVGGFNAIAGSIVGVASVFVGAGCSAWLYLRYAASLAAQP